MGPLEANAYCTAVLDEIEAGGTKIEIFQDILNMQYDGMSVIES